jgi:glycosyltransferase involved in cell wall biosynthesis
VARKISILVPDVASNILGAATAIARHLEPTFDVEIIGPDLGHGVNPMYRAAFGYKVISTPRLYRYPDFWRERTKLRDAVSGEIVIAVKAYANTVPLALELKRSRGCRVVAYLDEWDAANFFSKPAVERACEWFKSLHHPMDDAHFPRVEKMLPHCDLVISTTTFLQKKFGGEIVPFGVDTDFFKPQNPRDVEGLRAQYGLQGKKLIVFGGVVRPHKGVELILDALVLLGREDLKLVIVGPKNEHVETLLAMPAYASRLVALGPQLKNKMPLYLDLADLFVLPLTDSPLARSQMPCKIFEAMAMGKPVIATDVSDLAMVVKDCGFVVPSGNVRALAETIARVIRDDALAVQMGRAAREKCIREFSARITREKLARLMGSL